MSRVIPPPPFLLRGTLLVGGLDAHHPPPFPCATMLSLLWAVGCFHVASSRPSPRRLFGLRTFCAEPLFSDFAPKRLFVQKSKLHKKEAYY